MIKKFKLRHLSLLLEKKIDYKALMIDLNGYKDNWFNKKFVFLRCFNKTYKFIKQVKNIDPKKLVYIPSKNILCPNSIDDITFSAVMQAYTLMDNPKNKNTPDLIANLIAIVCFSENVSTDFNVENYRFKEFLYKIKNQPAFEMLGLYNHIDKMLTSSSLFWKRQFAEVYIGDKDYEAAGGEKMGAFNVINTIKNICSSFNLPYEKAWQMPYGVVQTSSLAKATENFIQNKMTEIKEAKMRASRKR